MSIYSFFFFSFSVCSHKKGPDVLCESKSGLIQGNRLQGLINYVANSVFDCLIYFLRGFVVVVLFFFFFVVAIVNVIVAIVVVAFYFLFSHSYFNSFFVDDALFFCLTFFVVVIIDTPFSLQTISLWFAFIWSENFKKGLKLNFKCERKFFVCVFVKKCTFLL